MASTNNTISQVEINGTTYDLLDANTLSAVSDLKQKVTALESSVVKSVTRSGNTFTAKNSAGTSLFTFDQKDDNTVYTHPTTAGNKHIPAGGSSGQILRWSAAGTAAWRADNNTTYTYSTSSLTFNSKVKTVIRNYIAKWHKIVIINFEVQFASTWNSWTAIATIPDGYRPTRGAFRFPLPAGHDWRCATASVDGSVLNMEANDTTSVPIGGQIIYSIS